MEKMPDKNAILKCMPRFYKYTLYCLYFYKENNLYISMHAPPQKKTKQKNNLYSWV